jgi:hypothetical protein
LQLLNQGELVGCFLGGPALPVNLAELKVQRRPLRFDRDSLLKGLLRVAEITLPSLKAPKLFEYLPIARRDSQRPLQQRKSFVQLVSIDKHFGQIQQRLFAGRCRFRLHRNGLTVRGHGIIGPVESLQREAKVILRLDRCRVEAQGMRKSGQRILHSIEGVFDAPELIPCLGIIRIERQGRSNPMLGVGIVVKQHVVEGNRPQVFGSWVAQSRRLGIKTQGIDRLVFSKKDIAEQVSGVRIGRLARDVAAEHTFRVGVARLEKVRLCESQFCRSVRRLAC